MTWVKLEDGFFRHPKARAAGKDGRALFVASVCFANANLTNGFIAKANLPIVAAEAEVKPATSRRLVEVVLWEAVEGGWQIHDYGDYQQSAESARRARDKGRERLAAWRLKQGQKQEGNADSNGVSEPVTNGDETGAYVDLDLDFDLPDSSRVVSSPSGARETNIPTSEDLEWALGEGYPQCQIDGETAKWREKSAGSFAYSTSKAWRGWLQRVEPEAPWVGPSYAPIPDLPEVPREQRLAGIRAARAAMSDRSS